MEIDLSGSGRQKRCEKVPDEGDKVRFRPDDFDGYASERTMDASGYVYGTAKYVGRVFVWVEYDGTDSSHGPLTQGVPIDILEVIE